MTACLLCGGSDWSFRHRFEARPEGETDFAIAPYRRELWQCGGCGHVENRHDMPLDGLYGAAYWDATYAGRIRETFARIMALPPGRSDNRGRVARIQEIWAERVAAEVPKTLLDIGSGLAVFPAAMAEAGWRCTVLDPDARAIAHAASVAGADGIHGDFMTLPLPLTPDRRFGLITLNKVLEHVPPAAMVPMLARTAGLLAPGGLIYVELPDGEAALKDSPGREEFFIEHYCAFSAASLALLAWRAGLSADLIERVREPSTKYTLRGFLTAGPFADADRS